MNKWQPSTQAQVFFAQSYLRELSDSLLNSEAIEVTVAQKKLKANASVLSLRTLWIHWLNEWAGYLKPKQGLNVYTSSVQFFSEYQGFAEVTVVHQSAEANDSWLKGILELERMDGIELLRLVDVLAQANDDAVVSAEQHTNELFVKQIDVRPLSAFNGLKDLESMLDALKQHISSTRAQHRED